jgi:DNA-binding HxlR family transcriptional regulator
VQIPPKVEYSITDFGRTLAPMTDFISGWGVQHSKRIEAALTALGRV